MTKVAFFNVDEKEQAILSKEFAGEKTFELRFNQKSLGKHTATIAQEEGGSAENVKAYFGWHPQNVVSGIK
jgi:hypothetical protein